MSPKAAAAIALMTIAAASVAGCSTIADFFRGLIGRGGDEAGPAPSPPPPPHPGAGEFSYHPAGALAPGSGQGSPDPTVYAPDMTFPVLDQPAYLNSQVYGYGGAHGPGGEGWCDPRNYAYPWRDNFCEARPGASRDTLNCPSRAVHQGQDIRAGTSEICNRQRALLREDRAANRLIPVVAAEDGFISNIGEWTVTLRAQNRIYRYLHLNMAALEVSGQEEVEAGEVIGYLSSDFGGEITTIHLHFELKENIDGVGWTWVSPYMSLVRAYERAIRRQGAALSAG